MSAVDDYFSSLDASAGAAVEHIRDLVMEMAPAAGQGPSYGMAALRYNQKPLLAVRAARQHLSIFPLSSRVVNAVRDQLTAFELSKGTIPFAAASPPPDQVVRDIVRYRVQEIAGRALRSNGHEHGRDGTHIRRFRAHTRRGTDQPDPVTECDGRRRAPRSSTRAYRRLGAGPAAHLRRLVRPQIRQL